LAIVNEFILIWAFSSFCNVVFTAVRNE